jgi:hypothetical protein
MGGDLRIATPKLSPGSLNPAKQALSQIHVRGCAAGTDLFVIVSQASIRPFPQDRTRCHATHPSWFSRFFVSFVFQNKQQTSQTYSRAPDAPIILKTSEECTGGAMRDIRAELQNRDDSVPVEWEPAEGDILVGFVRDASSVDSIDAGANVVVVEEERTGTPVLVSLASPHLAALFELHNPRGSDRIGIKCAGYDSSGVRRFTMLIDRGESPRSHVDKSSPRESEKAPESGDKNCGATPEERAFIENMFSQTMTPECADSVRVPEESPDSVFHRQEEVLARQTRAIERLESLVSRALPLDDSSPAPSAVDANTSSGTRVKARRKWLAALLMFIAAIAATGIGVACAILLRPSLHMWIR